MADNINDYAREGTLAHSLGEKMLLFKLGRIKAQTYAAALRKIKKNDLYDDEMLEYISRYAEFVLSRFEDAKAVSADAVIEIEQRLDFSKWARGGFGTGDAVIVTDGYIEVIDLKYGQGVKVDAYENPQLKLYGLGAYESSDFLFDVNKVQVTVYQPRVNNVSSFEIETIALLNWADTIVKPQAEKALLGEGEFIAGEHCRFCKAGATCRTRSEKSLELAKHDFCDPDLLSDEELREILERGKELSKWVTAVEQHILASMLGGNKIKGLKVVESTSRRVIGDTKKASEILKSKGFASEKIYEPQKLIALGKLEKLVGGKKKFEELLKDCIVKPAGKPTVVSETDQRPEYNTPEMDFRK